MSAAATIEYYDHIKWDDPSPRLITIVRPRASSLIDIPEAVEDREPDPVLTEAQYLSNEKADYDAFKVAASALEESLFADDSERIDALEAEALSALSGSYNALAVLALCQDYAPDVRGVAARLFVESLIDVDEENELLAALAECDQPLVRLGVVYGVEDNADQQLLRKFMDDTHPRVRMEAKRIYGRP